MSNILKQYNISFENSILSMPVTKTNEVFKTFYVSNEQHAMLALFFIDYYNVEDLQENVFDLIQNIFDGKSSEEHTGTQSGIATYITFNEVKFVDFHSPGTYLNPDLRIPTSDFLEIANEWRNFLQEEPFNGTIVK